MLTCDRKMKEAIPVMSNSIEGLLRITKPQLDELKTINNPIPTIKILMTAVCMILRIKPTAVSNKETNYVQTLDYWKSAVGPQCLGNYHVIKTLTQIDPTKLDAEVMTQVEKLFDEHHVDEAKVDKACIAARGIY